MALDVQYIDFLGYRLNRVARTLTAPDGSDVALNARAFDVLCHLIEHRPRVVGKDELLAAAWPGRVVEENNLGQAISSLRRAFGTDANDHRFIRTVPGRGYCFVAAVEEPSSAPDAPATAAVAPTASRRQWRILAVAASILLLLSLAFVATRAWQERDTMAAATATNASTTVAVLPFRPIDPRPGDETLGLGIADTVITRLSGTTRLRVLSLGSVQALAGKTVDSLRAGSMLGADYLVEGHLQHNDGSVRISARLLAVRDGRTLWAGTFDRNENNVFELQDEIASGVATKLSQTYRAARRSAGCMGDDPVAYRSYLRGYALINRPSPRTVEQADAAFREALARDPQCARALAGISQAARLRVMVSDGDPEVEFPNAEAAVARALKIDPDSAEAYSERGALLFWYRWNWPEAEASFQHAIELDPNLVAARISLAHLYSNLKRYDLAAPESRIAVALDPLSPIVNALAAAFIESTGQQREAHVHLQAALELEPDFWVALLHRGFGSLFDGDRQAAERDLLHVTAETGRSTRSLVYLARFYVLDDRPDQARAVLAELEARRASGEYVLPSALAQVHLVLGEKRQALDLLEEGYRHGDLGMAFLIDWFPGLAGEPRYATLLHALRLPSPATEDTRSR